MTTAPQFPAYPMTAEEYLAFDHASEHKHEYVDGFAVRMAGASDDHNLIVAAIIGALFGKLSGGPCRVRPSDMRVAIPGGNYRYPDLTVTCGEARFEPRDDGLALLLNPTLIVEVLSASTEKEDRGAKVWEYQQIASVQDYLIVAQGPAQVLHHQRRDERSWLLTQYTQLEQSIALPALGIALKLQEIYVQV